MTIKSLEDDLLPENRESLCRLLCDDLPRNLERIIYSDLISRCTCNGTKGKRALKLSTKILTALKGCRVVILVPPFNDPQIPLHIQGTERHVQLLAATANRVAGKNVERAMATTLESRTKTPRLESKQDFQKK